MTGPEHYREAERLATMAHRFTYGDGADPVVGAALAAEAQVHATLALTAATAMQAGVDGSEPGMSGPEFTQWYRTAGVKPTAPTAEDDDHDGMTNADVIGADELHEMDQADEATLDAEAGEQR